MSDSQCVFHNLNALFRTSLRRPVIGIAWAPAGAPRSGLAVDAPGRGLTMSSRWRDLPALHALPAALRHFEEAVRRRITRFSRFRGRFSLH